MLKPQATSIKRRLSCPLPKISHERSRGVMAAFRFCWHTWPAGNRSLDGTADPGNEPPLSPGENHSSDGQAAEGWGISPGAGRRPC